MSRIRYILFASIMALSGSRAAAQQPDRSGPCVVEIAPTAARYPVNGRVIDNLTGRPIAGASVSLSSICQSPRVDGQPERKAWSAVVTSDDHGEFLFRDVPVMWSSLNATLDGYVQTRGAEDLTRSYHVAADNGPITLRLTAMHSISGVVRGGDGASIADAQVLLFSCAGDPGWPMRGLFGVTQTAADGSYSYRHVSPGRYQLIAEVWHSFQEPGRDEQGRFVGYVPVSVPSVAEDVRGSCLEVPEGQETTVDFELRKQLLHRVTGTTSVQASVKAVDSNGAGGYAVRSTGPKLLGFETWLPNGDFHLESDFASSDGEFIGSIPVEVNGGDIEGIHLPLVSRKPVTVPIAISAASPDKGQLVRQVLHFLTYRFDSDCCVRFASHSTATYWMRDTGANRRESIDMVPGSHMIALAPSGNVYPQSISRDGADLIHEPLVVGAGAEPSAIRVVVAEGARVEGITRRLGNPARAYVYALPEQPDGMLLRQVISSADGKFSVEGLAPARYLFFASSVIVPLDVRTAAELPARWQRSGRSVALEAGKGTSLDLDVNVP